MEYTLSLEFWLIIILLISLSLIILYIYYDRKRVREKNDTAYIEGLRYMAEGENRRALEKFKEAVRKDSQNVDAYTKIGLILRQEGLFNNAIRVHKDLNLRGNLTPEQKTDIRQNLALDYWFAGNYQRAEEYFNQLKENKNLLDWLTPYLVKIYARQDRWEEAFTLFKQSKYSGTEKGKARLAYYRMKQGEAMTPGDDEKAARVLFKEAFKLDPHCAEAYLNLGDSYIREDRTSDAIDAWMDLCKKVPEKAHLAFGRLEKALYERGQFSKIEELYLGILQENEDNLEAILSLSDIYRKKGEYNEALKLLQQSMKKDLPQDRIQVQLVRVLFDKNQYKEAAKAALDVLESKQSVTTLTSSSATEDEWTQAQ